MKFTIKVFFSKFDQTNSFLYSDMGIKNDKGGENNAIISKSLTFILFLNMFNSAKESFFVNKCSQGPMKRGVFVRTDAVIISPCFPEVFSG